MFKYVQTFGDWSIKVKTDIEISKKEAAEKAEEHLKQEAEAFAHITVLQSRGYEATKNVNREEWVDIFSKNPLEHSDKIINVLSSDKNYSFNDIVKLKILADSPKPASSDLLKAVAEGTVPYELAYAALQCGIDDTDIIGKCIQRKDGIINAEVFLESKPKPEIISEGDATESIQNQPESMASLASLMSSGSASSGILSLHTSPTNYTSWAGVTNMLAAS
ncbi:hypothetical protein V5E43_003294 [Yersinia enterocolitica]